MDESIRAQILWHLGRMSGMTNASAFQDSRLDYETQLLLIQNIAKECEAAFQILNKPKTTIPNCPISRGAGFATRDGTQGFKLGNDVY